MCFCCRLIEASVAERIATEEEEGVSRGSHLKVLSDFNLDFTVQ